MNTVRDEIKLRAWPIGVAAAVSLPAMLLSGAATAQAETNPTYFANQDGSLEVRYGGDRRRLHRIERREPARHSSTRSPGRTIQPGIRPVPRRSRRRGAHRSAGQPPNGNPVPLTKVASPRQPRQ